MNTAAPMPMSAEGVLAIALLQVLTEMAVRLGLDPDGSLTTSRVMAAVHGLDQVAAAFEPAAAPWRDAARASRALVRSRLHNLRPLVSRLALAGVANDP